MPNNIRKVIIMFGTKIQLSLIWKSSCKMRLFWIVFQTPWFQTGSDYSDVCLYSNPGFEYFQYKFFLKSFFNLTQRREKLSDPVTLVFSFLQKLWINVSANWSATAPLPQWLKITKSLILIFPPKLLNLRENSNIFITKLNVARFAHNVVKMRLFERFLKHCDFPFFEMLLQR